jgi:hypothetical protein
MLSFTTCAPYSPAPLILLSVGDTGGSRQTWITVGGSFTNYYCVTCADALPTKEVGRGKYFLAVKQLVRVCSIYALYF